MFKNVYDIRRDERLYYIISSENKYGGDKKLLSKSAVVCYLYYIEDLEKYLHYILPVSNVLDVYIISANDELLESIADSQAKEPGHRMHLLSKENRGRDVGALLVTARSIFEKYDYVCFIHDKKSKHERWKIDVDEWTKELWDNMIGTVEYVYNVLDLFLKNNQLGMLVPLEPFTEHEGFWYFNGWVSNYENTRRLCEKLKLETNLDEKKPPISLGTVFWCRSKTLKKLFEYGWSLEDFPEEPLADDGEISHAIERIFPYVAQDAGYSTGMIMNKATAVKRLALSQYEMGLMSDLLYEYLGVSKPDEIENFKYKVSQVTEYCERKGRIYLYGAGAKAIECLKLINLLHINIDGVIVTIPEDDMASFKGYPIYGLNDVVLNEETGIIISVGIIKKDEIAQILLQRGFSDYICYA